MLSDVLENFKEVSQCSLISYLYFFVRPSFTLLALVAKALKRPSKRSIVAKIRDNRYIFLEKGIARDSAEGK